MSALSCVGRRVGAGVGGVGSWGGLAVGSERASVVRSVVDCRRLAGVGDVVIRDRSTMPALRSIGVGGALRWRFCRGSSVVATFVVSGMGSVGAELDEWIATVWWSWLALF